MSVDTEDRNGNVQNVPLSLRLGKMTPWTSSKLEILYTAHLQTFCITSEHFSFSVYKKPGATIPARNNLQFQEWTVVLLGKLNINFLFVKVESSWFSQNPSPPEI